MKKNYFLYVILLFLLLFIAIIYLNNERISAKKEAERWKINYYKQNMQSMSVKEFEHWIKVNNKNLLDTFSKIIDNKIKPKQVVEYQKIVNYYKDTNLIVINLDSLLKNSKDSLIDLEYFDKNKCWGFKGEYNTQKNVFNIKEKYANDTITIIEYWTRKKILFFKIGKKIYSRKAISNCGTEIKEIKIKVEQ